ncbi:MAG: glycosyltransferase [Bryobacteraceae bacterium]
MLLSAALIVRDEEEQLRGCLGSVEKLVDEVVVVDTGSLDGSRDVARHFGARVEEFAWCEDFSAARNRGLDLVRGDWVLYIDADERVLPCDFGVVRAQLADPAYAGYEVLLRPRPRYTPYWILRLFRSDPTIRFRGVIHENIWPAVEAYAGGVSHVGRSPLLLDHAGYEGDQVRKHRRNLPLLRAALRDDPSSIYCWCHLADIHTALGEPDLALCALETALAMVRAKPLLSPDDSLPYVRLIHRGMDSGHDVSALLAEARERFPENAQLMWFEGRDHIASGRFESAIPLFLRLARFGETREFDCSSAFDSRIFGVLSYDSLATCCFRLGRYQESRRYYQLAEAADPGRLDYRAKQALCARLAHGGGGNA